MVFDESLLSPLSAADVIIPNWPRIPCVRAVFTTRVGGVSAPPYGQWRNGQALPGGLNLAFHTGDDPQCVTENRARLAAFTGARPAWLKQIHHTQVIRAETVLDQDGALYADATVATQPNLACVVTSADCLAVLICDTAGRAVGAAHAGWRGLSAGVLEHTATEVATAAGAGSTLTAFLGPAIGPRAFEVGDDVRDAFMDSAQPDEYHVTAAAFHPYAAAPGKYRANLYALARVRLARAGITRISNGAWCTFSEPERFYSYRRDHPKNGNQAAMIWLTDNVDPEK